MENLKKNRCFDISVILPTLRPERVRRCIERVAEVSPGVNYEIVLVSPLDLEKELVGCSGYERLHFVREKEKQGSCYANTLGWEKASGKYVFAIADDHMLGLHCLRNLIEFMKPHDEEIFLGGARCYGVSGPGCEHTVYGMYYAYNPCIRRELVAQIGGFYDPYYRCYWGDPDLALRVWHHGGKAALCPDAWIEFNNASDAVDSESQEKYKERDYLAFVKRWHSIYGTQVKSSKFEDINIRNKGAYPGLPPEKCTRLFVFLQKKDWAAVEDEVAHDGEVFLNRAYLPDVFSQVQENRHAIPLVAKCKMMRWLCNQLYGKDGSRTAQERSVSREEKQWIIARIVSDINLQHSLNQNLTDSRDYLNDILSAVGSFYASKEYVKRGPTLVIEGYKGINIIYYEQRFFSWPQEFKGFCDQVFSAKKDKRLFHEDKIFKIFQKLNELFAGEETADWRAIRECEEKSSNYYFIFSILNFFLTNAHLKGSPELVIEGYKGVNVIHLGRKYYSWHQRLGGFQIELFDACRDKFAFSGEHIYELIEKIDQESGTAALIDWRLIQQSEKAFLDLTKCGSNENLFQELSNLTNKELCCDVILMLNNKDWAWLEKSLENCLGRYSLAIFFPLVYATALEKLSEAPRAVVWRFCYWLTLQLFAPRYGYKPIGRIPFDHIFPFLTGLIDQNEIPKEIQKIIESEAGKVEELKDDSQEFKLYWYMQHYFAVFKEAGKFNPVFALRRKYFASNSLGSLKLRIQQYEKLPEKQRANASFLSMIKQKTYEVFFKKNDAKSLSKDYKKFLCANSEKTEEDSVRFVDVKKYSVTPPILIISGYRDYNIIRSWDGYYGLNQRLGEFSLFEFKEKREPDVFFGKSILAVKSLIDKYLGLPARRDEQVFDWALLTKNELLFLCNEKFDPKGLVPVDDVLLVVEGYRQFNIVHCNGLYFGWPWSAGGFFLQKFLENSSGYGAVVAEFIAEVKVLIDLKLGSPTLEEQDKHDWARMHEVEVICDNKYRCKNNIREKAQVLDSLPTVMIVSTAVGCNIRCRMCYLQSDHELSYGGSSARKNMSEETFSRVLGLLPKLDTAIMTVEGEILLHRKWVERWLEIIRQKKNLKLSFQTNGMLMNHDAINMVLENTAIEHVAFSVDGVTPDVFEFIRCGAKMEVVFRNIAALSAEKKKRKLRLPNIHTHFVMQKTNIHELPGYVEKMVQLGVNSMSARHLITYHKEQIKDSLFFHQQLSDEMVEKAKAVAKELGVTVDLPVTFHEANKKNAVNRPACFDPWKHGQILNDGGIYSCCNNAVLMGNINDEGGFEGVWNNEKYQLLRKTVNAKDPAFTLCKYCNALMPVNCFEAHVYTKFLFKLLANNELDRYCPRPVQLLIRPGEKLVE